MSILVQTKAGDWFAPNWVFDFIFGEHVIHEIELSFLTPILESRSTGSIVLTSLSDAETVMILHSLRRFRSNVENGEIVLKSHEFLPSFLEQLDELIGLLACVPVPEG